MLEGTYKPYLNMLALKQLVKPAAIPNIELCIGDAERLSHVPLTIPKAAPVAQPKAIVEDASKIPYEKVGIVGQYDPLELKDFNHEFYLGDPLGRW